MVTEQWALIEKSKRYKEVRFYISNFGNIKSVNVKTKKPLPCTPYVNEKGYLEASRPKKGEIGKLKIRIHVEVAKHFVGGYFENSVVNHMDKNKLNCRWDNLEYVTIYENNLHNQMKYTGSAKGLKLGDYPMADHVTNRSKKINCFDLSGTFIKTYPSINAAARDINTSAKRIIEVVKGFKSGDKNKKVKSHKGYVFKFA